MKQAYLERKLRFKQEALAPVGPGGATALAVDAGERAQFRLLEVDMAWETLRNPAARARYDDQLRGTSTDVRRRDPHDPFGLRAKDARAGWVGAPDRSRATPAGGEGGEPRPVAWDPMGVHPLRDAGARRNGASGATAEPVAITLLPVGDQSWADGSAGLAVGGHSASIWERRKQSEVRAQRGVDLADAAELAPASATPPPEATRWVRWAPILIGAVVLVLVLGWGALAARRPEPAISIDTTQQLGVGRCVRFVDDPALGVAATDANGPRIAQGVGCDQEHNARVVARVPFPTACPRGRPLVLADEKTSVCLS